MADRTSPVANLILTTGVVGMPVIIDGSTSFAPKGTIKRWSLDFGDGSNVLTGRNQPLPVEHVYEEVGEFIVTLTVYDNRGNSGTERETVSITATPGPPPPLPVPVDCVLSDWTLKSSGPWSDCVDGAQKKEEVWSRTIVTAPANGGAPCGPLEETRIVTQPCGVEPPPPPVPVDCELSAWGEWMPVGEWSDCINGQQTRTEERRRSVVTTPSNGGAPCGPLIETRIVSQACETPPPPPPVEPGDHGYFNALVKLSQHFYSRSLRDQAQLDGLVAQGPSTYFSYKPGSDAYPLRQDAAKLIVGPKPRGASVPTEQQLRMYLPLTAVGVRDTLLFIWDWWWGPEFLKNRGNFNPPDPTGLATMNHYKVFKFQFNYNHSGWTVMNSPTWVSQAPTGPEDVAKNWDSLATGGGPPTGLVRREPWTPAGVGSPDQRSGSGEQPRVLHSRWYRYWVEVKLYQPHTAFSDWNAVTGQTLQPSASNAKGEWHMVSKWTTDDTGTPRRILYRIPWGWSANWDGRINRFDFEMNTSQGEDGYTFLGPLIGYGRNVVVLRNYALPSVPETDTFIFQKPVA